MSFTLETDAQEIKLHKLFLELFNGTFIWDPKGLAE